MGLLREYIWLRRYLRVKAESDLIDALENEGVASKSKKNSRRLQKDFEKSEAHHLGFWDFLDKQIQEEKKEANENPTSWKEVLKVIGGLLLISFVFLLLALLYQLAERWINGIF